MPTFRELIDTIVIVMMENRSFDHVLGHLSYDGTMPEVNGLKRPINQQAYWNLFETSSFSPWKMQDRGMGFDPPHEYYEVATQLNANQAGKIRMSGFVRAYYEKMREEAVKRGMTVAEAKQTYVPGTRIECMGFYAESQVPISSFFAQNFGVCDNWFCSIPTSTQPNRTFALCGDTPVFETKTRLIGVNDIVLDWLERNQVRYRVYHDGLSFFTFYPRTWDAMLSQDPKIFRPFESLLVDYKKPVDTDTPQVIFVEPSYASAPHIGSDRPNDNHAPVPMRPGEEFLRDVYVALTANPDRWKRTVLLVYYDEHGGLYDHVSPPKIGYEVRDDGQVKHSFESLGPRVPAMVVSPLVPKGTVLHQLFDHTSLLQFLAEMYTPGTPYSATVDARRQAGIKSLSEALTLTAPRSDLPTAPPAPMGVPPLSRTAPPGVDATQEAFHGAAHELLNGRRSEVEQKLPELIHWEASDSHG